MTPPPAQPPGKSRKGSEFAHLLRILMQRGPLADPTDHTITTLGAIVDRRRETVQRWLACVRVPRETEVYERLATAYGVHVDLVSQAARLSSMRSRPITSAHGPRFDEVQRAAAEYHRLIESENLSMRALDGDEAALIDSLRKLGSEYGVPYAHLLRRAVQIRQWMDARPPLRLLEYITGGTPPPLFEGIPHSIELQAKTITMTLTKKKW